MLNFRIFKLNPEATALDQGCALTIGNFDGVHLGHQALLSQLQKHAHDLKKPAAVVLFEPQPKEFLKPEDAPFRLFSLREKIFILKQMKIDYVICLHFNKTLSLLHPQAFVHELLIHRFKAQYILIGPDFHFGRQRQGTPLDFQQLAFQKGVDVEIFSEFQYQGEKISSTRIRELCQNHQFDEMQKCLGFPYFYLGRVGYGKQLAGTWGVPTANIRVFAQKKGLNGVFCVKIKSCLRNSESVGLANIGVRPTVDGLKRMLEVHILDEQVNLYGDFLQVIVLHGLRNEQRFSSLNELKQQIQMDVLSARKYFEQLN